VTRAPTPYPSPDDPPLAPVINGHYVKSSFSCGNDGCLAFTVAGGLIGIQDDKLPPAERKARTLIVDRHAMAAFIAGVKNGDFDHLVD
jgi:hypothetical protein